MAAGISLRGEESHIPTLERGNKGENMVIALNHGAAIQGDRLIFVDTKIGAVPQKIPALDPFCLASYNLLSTSNSGCDKRNCPVWE
jgi:hypothetical protein